MQQGVTEFHKITGTVQINLTLSVLTQFWKLEVHQKNPSFNPDLEYMSVDHLPFHLLKIIICPMLLYSTNWNFQSLSQGNAFIQKTSGFGSTSQILSFLYSFTCLLLPLLMPPTKRQVSPSKPITFLFPVFLCHEYFSLLWLFWFPRCLHFTSTFPVRDKTARHISLERAEYCSCTSQDLWTAQTRSVMKIQTVRAGLRATSMLFWNWILFSSSDPVKTIDYFEKHQMISLFWLNSSSWNLAKAFLAKLQT